MYESEVNLPSLNAPLPSWVTNISASTQRVKTSKSYKPVKDHKITKL